jgi:hypothetical protein
MAGQVSDHDGAAAALRRVRDLAAGPDLTPPDSLYQADKAEQLVRATKGPSPRLRMVAAGRRLRRHLVEDHGHLGDHRAGLPAGQPHARDHGGGFLGW